MQYFGIDWVATVAGLTGVYLIGNKNKFGFLIMMIASLSWMTVGFMIQSLALILGSGVFFSLHVRGWIKWRREARADLML
ncbi:MAG: nicotinamide mononucleotide transporter [Pyrinomonadaceae bacterium]